MQGYTETHTGTHTGTHIHTHTHRDRDTHTGTRTGMDVQKERVPTASGPHVSAAPPACSTPPPRIPLHPSARRHRPTPWPLVAEAASSRSCPCCVCFFYKSHFLPSPDKNAGLGLPGNNGPSQESWGGGEAVRVYPLYALIAGPNQGDQRPGARVTHHPPPLRGCGPARWWRLSWEGLVNQELITQLRGSQHLPCGEKEKVSDDLRSRRHTGCPAGADTKLSSKLPGKEDLETRKEQTNRQKEPKACESWQLQGRKPGSLLAGNLGSPARAVNLRASELCDLGQNHLTSLSHSFLNHKVKILTV